MRFPGNSLQVEEDPGFLRAGGPAEVQQVKAFPIENFPGADFFFIELWHGKFP
jgi:hypothetical protein